MKPWREIALPHRDVLEGTFQQSEFAADLTAVQEGRATDEYQDAQAFYERTFITEGMRLLLTQVAQRLCGQGGEPVVQLQTNFGGGKTHTLLAVYHMAARQCPLTQLNGLSALIDAAGLVDLPQARVAALDGNAHEPAKPWRHGKQAVATLWGELAWQLGGAEGYALVQESDRTGTSPGKNSLRDLLERYAPCVVLVDELVAYVRQFAEGQTLSGGSYDSNLSFVQALTEAAKLVPNAIVLASLPESEAEAGSQRGAATLKSLEKVFGRVQALWKPVATEEAFEIVRRRLFEPVRDTAARDEVCRAFAKAYIDEGAKLPSETQESRYRERLTQAYPIHPEVFDRLYVDWTTIDGFQRTRGVLKLMAKVIYRLWKDDNKDLMILPGSLPLYDGSTRSELTYYLNAGWDAVIEADVDGARSETRELESKEPRFGQVNAARRVARTLFLGTAPSAAATKPGIRGLDRARVLLGCLQPGQPAAVFSDALNRLADRLHYLNSSGDRAADSTRYWFDTRANLRREMEDRKRRFNETTDVRNKVSAALRRATAGATLFDGVHLFAPHGDVPDDPALRLVVLPPEAWYNREEARWAETAIREYLQNNGSKPRLRANRLIFLAADHATLPRLMDAARVALAWGSIVDDVREGRLNIDLLQKKQAEKELQTADEVLPRAARECYRWLLCPVLFNPTDKEIQIESFALNTGGTSFSSEIQRICEENELVISTWSPIHLRDKLRALYWKPSAPAKLAEEFWEDTLRYLYLPRLKSRDVLGQAIRAGANGRDFFGIAYGKVGDEYEGFAFGTGGAQFDNTLLLIEPGTAQYYEDQHRTPEPEPGGEGGSTGGGVVVTPITPINGGSTTPVGPTKLVSATRYHGSAQVPAATAKMKLMDLADEIINLLTSDPLAEVSVTLEISAECPAGISESIKRAVTENARVLGLKYSDWE